MLMTMLLNCLLKPNGLLYWHSEQVGPYTREEMHSFGAWEKLRKSGLVGIEEYSSLWFMPAFMECTVLRMPPNVPPVALLSKRLLI